LGGRAAIRIGLHVVRFDCPIEVLGDKLPDHAPNPLFFASGLKPFSDHNSIGERVDVAWWTGLESLMLMFWEAAAQFDGQFVQQAVDLLR
jgi:hypothetical protein